MMRPDFYWIPKVVAENVQPHEAFVFAVVYWFANLKDGRCYASNERIAQALPYKSTANSVGNALLRLEYLGYVQRLFEDDTKARRSEILCLVKTGRVPSTGGTRSTQGLTRVHPQVEVGPPTDGQISNNDNKERLLSPIAPKGGREGFDRFWKAYPRKIAKPTAERSWKALHLTETDVDKVLAGLDEWKGSEQWERDGGRFIPHPATFLNQRRWEDEVPKKDLGFISFNK